MEWRTPPDLCGHLTAIQDSIDAIQDNPSTAAFLRHALIDTPGVIAIQVSLDGVLHPHERSLEEARRAFAAAAVSPLSIDLAQLQTGLDYELFPVATPRRLYGFLAANVQDQSAFAPYRCYFKAVAGIVAHSLAARRQASELDVAKSELEAHVIVRRCAEALYKDCQQEHWEAQEIAGLGCWDWEPASEIYHWSDTLNRIFGRNPNRPPPDFEEFLTYVHPSDRKAVRDNFSATLKTGIPLPSRYRIIRFDGEERILETWTRGFRNKDGKISSELLG